MKKRLLFCVLSIFILIMFSGCNAGDTTYYMELNEYKVYENGKAVFTLSEENDDFYFSKADKFSLDAANIETKRGLKMGDSVERLVELYGKQVVFIDSNPDEEIDDELLEDDEAIDEDELRYNEPLEEYAASDHYLDTFTVLFTTNVFDGKVIKSRDDFSRLLRKEPKVHDIHRIHIEVHNGVVEEIQIYLWGAIYPWS